MSGYTQKKTHLPQVTIASIDCISYWCFHSYLSLHPFYLLFKIVKEQLQLYVHVHVCVCVCVCVCYVLQYVCRSQRTSYGNQSSPFTIGILGSNSGYQAWWQVPLPVEASHFLNVFWKLPTVLDTDRLLLA